MPADYHAKVRAREALDRAVDKGQLVRPAVCEECGKAGPTEGHHHDYTRPLDVRWLCTRCHRRAHSQPGPIPEGFTGTHGKVGSYTNGCRCTACKAAFAAYYAAHKARRKAMLASANPRHGVYSTYTTWGCRCGACKAAAAEQTRRYRARQINSC